ncbi:MAG TPA: Gfo/Idh/MocA family oxidoreductase, partial [Chitinophaga sp.]
LGQQKVFGPVQTIQSNNGFVFGGTDNSAWRLKKKLAGGGPLMDMGIYVIQGARYTTGEEPLWVKARQEKTRPEFFNEVEETVYWQMAFPGGCLATCKTSYNENGNSLHANAAQGWFELSEAYRYGGMAGATSKGPMNFPQINQQAAQMDAFVRNVRSNTPSLVAGEEGRLDMKVVEAIYRSLDSGQQENV